MAYLLGSKYCVESLTSDVKDLQGAVVDVSSRVGPVRYPSWKFPDKVSSDLDIDDFLEDCVYSEDDEEDNQVAHIKLIEMVVDRMVLLLQSFTRFTDHMLSKTAGRPPSASPKIVGTQMSVGMVVKKFWNKVVQLNVLLQQLYSENRSKTQSVNKLEIINRELQHQARKLSSSDNEPSVLNPLRDQLSAGPSTAQHSEMLTSAAPLSGRISADVRSVASQTLETSFVPCDACYQVQLSFREVQDMVVDICKAQGLSSAIMKHQQAAVEEVMTAADIVRWRKEGEKDLNRIRGHLSSLMAQVDPLKLGLEESKRSCKGLSKNLSEITSQLSKERQDRETKVAQYESQMKGIERNHKASLAAVKQSYEDLARDKSRVDQEAVRLKLELSKQCDALEELDSVRKRLQETLTENNSRKNLILRLESDVAQMTEQLQSIHREIEDVNRRLGKEQAKNRSMEKQGQAMQVKHDVLAQHVDELDQESQELRDQLAEMEDTRDEAVKDLERAQDEMKELAKNLQREKELARSVKSEKEFLEESINDLKTIILSLEDEIGDGQERERLLVQYPERNPSLVPHPPKTGVDEEDMKSQVQANSIRMQVLEEENNLLRRNISKLLDGREDGNMHHGGVQIQGPAIALWQTGGVKPNQRGRGSAESSSRMQQRDSVIPSRNNLEPPDSLGFRGRKKDQRVDGRQSVQKPARRQQSAKESSSIQAYTKLRKAGSLNPGTGDTKGKHSAADLKPPRARPGWASGQSKRSSTADSYTKQDMFMCPSCDKMYPTQRDIDIHSSYCYG